jgi:hypothetical protein
MNGWKIPDEVFPPGSRLDAIVDYIKENAPAR